MTDETRLAVAALEDKTVNELRTLYEEVFDEVCRSRHKKYLVRRIAWRLQALDEGGLSNEAKQKARELAATSDLRMTAPREEVLDNVRRATPEEDGYVDWDPRLPPPGSFLERRYKGTMVRVLVLTDGFEYEGKRFRSLSKVAGVITGVSYNGFLFFRLGRIQK
ncbi:hypothetical protein SV7mr_30110 [Stieleria bergensis]|uniref:DUF2924 domain-containing protein n=1 Tax=Stieleria bergensis TaxID=2528025 RepID=A0A517SWH9_9BACT|nr:hypothetical protein SV7mr_30110 [Planctomycetes bacterium SV_7m_r]